MSATKDSGWGARVENTARISTRISYYQEEEEVAPSRVTVPSSAGTENADTPTVPGSPLSTNTSISTSGGNEETALKPEVKEVPKSEPEEAIDEAQPSVASVIESSDSSSKDQEVAATPTQAAVPPSRVPTPKVEAAPAPEPVPEPVPEPSASTSTSSTPAPAAAAPKKSWASLLRPAESSSATATPTKNALPTSSIVGFSIPAGVTTSAPPQPVSPSKKTELINLLTSNPSSGPFTSKIRPRGLVNSGNMCFANSVLQILLYCQPFHRLFLEIGKLLPPTTTQKDNAASGSSSASSSATPLVEATATFLKEFVTQKKPLINGKSGVKSGVASGSGYGRSKGKERELMEMDDDWDLDSFLPTYIYDAMKEKKRFDTMRGGQQEDAEEFLGFYLDTLEEELLSMLNSTQPSKPHVEETEAVPTKEDGWMEVGKKNRTVVTRTIKATESPITRIFGGKFRSTLRAPRQKDSVVVEDWRSLRLDIQRDQIRTIQDALSKCILNRFPPILVLHIKRFCYDMNVKGVVKVGKQVQFGPELEIGADLMATAAKKTGPTRYKLFGAVYHHGPSASGGHYTLDVLHPNRYPSLNPNAKPKEGWVRIDDDLVSDVRPDDVFGAAQEKDDSRCAYLLFYSKVVCMKHPPILISPFIDKWRQPPSNGTPDARLGHTTLNRQAVMLGTGFDILNLDDDHAHRLVQLIYASLHLILITTGIHLFLSIYGFSVFKEARAGKRKQARVPYLSVGFAVSALFCAYNILTSVYLAELLINTGTEETAFEEFIVEHMGGWLSVWATVCQMGISFIGTGFLIYRCYLVWEKKIWVVLFPSFACVTSFALAVVLLVGLRRSSMVKTVPFQYGCAWVSLSAGANIYSSSLIAFRLLQARFRDKESKGDLQQFTDLSAILVESALPFSLFGVASAVVYSPSLAVKPPSVPVMATWTCLSALAVQFIAFRVVIGMSYTHGLGAADPKESEKGIPEPMTFAREPPNSTATHETRQTISHVSA
ncbi:hypothetical protein EST38_g12880 [Candolleomyces aberdarensis]|uniref:ubiquitinyl hydrolase 1 n=1 Tax=Candolleomyces aberdarensis TaxID=2316362 RepID=A0A4Q2D3M3_9AGAR|nr:hypothetical protein EST38_g12880 [Candolleomyces aberdarensis]